MLLEVAVIGMFSIDELVMSGGVHMKNGLAPARGRRGMCWEFERL